MGYRLLVHSALQIATSQNGSRKQITLFKSKDGDGCCILVDREGKIADIGYNSECVDKYASCCDKLYDASGQCIIPGLIDGHTHPVWAGDRVHEFAMKLAGATYMDIHKAGGGINFTVEKTRHATHSELLASFKDRLNKLVKSGVTMVECKSGYGLDYSTELKLLQVINQGMHDPEVKCGISVTYCGAHSVPKGSTADEAADDIINNQIPKLRALCKSSELHIDNIDVFCEKGVFNVELSKQMLQAGRDAGWCLNFHAEELSCLNSAEMGAEVGALVMSHLEEVSDEGIKMMAEKDCIAMILPTTAYLLHLKPPPVRKMLDAGVCVALGTDFNPNAFCLSMPLVMNLACVTLGMTMEEALCAATINSAASLNKALTHGSIEAGKYADFVCIDAPSWEHIIYQMGNTENIIKHVVRNGEFVYSRSN